MGNGCKRMPPPTQIIASENDMLNQRFSLAHFCAPAGTVGGYAAPYIDKAGEYTYAGEGGTCRYCSLDAPRSVSCAVGCADASCCAIVGKGATFQRTSYKGDKETCCMGGEPRVDSDGKTCHPEHAPHSQQCKAIILSRCKMEKEKFLEPGHTCSNYATFYPDEGVALKCDACNDWAIFSKQESICTKLCLENPGLCDYSSNVYCDTPAGRNTSYCSCINDDSLNNPICTNAECRTAGYITNGIKDRECIINNCKVDLSFENIRNLDINQLDIQQTCGNDREPPPETKHLIKGTREPYSKTIA
ncbi:hypothetical protein SK128_011773 [Halocaridina rubra]|uniref:Uncharacterized protein n=1 Tax=Halocaridina rubra TaxID=373956 RepID=A0AAN8XD28_HALRR